MNVLEISKGAAAGYAGLLLAELGFTVHRIAVEDPNDHSDATAQLARSTFLHRNKTEHAVNAVDFTAYDAVVEDVGRGALERLGLSHRSIRRANPNLVLVSLSDFGLFGPYSDWSSTDICAQAAGGVVHVTGYSGEAPRKLPGDTAAMIAGLHGATAVASTVFGIQSSTETGVHIDISAQDTFMQHWTRHVSDYAHTGTSLPRQPRDPEGIHYRHTTRARDGWVYILALREPWQDVAAFLGLGDFVPADGLDPSDPQPWEAMEPAFTDAVASKDKYRWFADAALMGWTFAPVETPADIVNGPQTHARGSMRAVAVTTEDGPKTVHVPGLPYRIEPHRG